MHRIVKWIDHNRYFAFVLLVAVAIVGWLIGCQPMTQSVQEPGRMVTATELEREGIAIQRDFEAKMAVLELAQADIERQVALRQQAIEIIGGLAQAATTGTFSPATGINAAITLLGLIGLGAVADNRRKDAKLAAK